MQASAFSLLGDSYVWILPHYQHPTWWRRNESNTNRADMNSPLNGLDKRINCSDSEMVDLLQSVLFVDSLKYNVMATADDDGSETRAFHLVRIFKCMIINYPSAHVRRLQTH